MDVEILFSFGLREWSCAPGVLKNSERMKEASREAGNKSGVNPSFRFGINARI